LDKKQERWWEAVLTSEPKINVRKIDASRPMTDLVFFIASQISTNLNRIT
jgi:hypothetical protein